MKSVSMAAAFGVLLVIFTPLGAAIPLSSFYSYGSAAGDSSLPKTDDGSSNAISLPSPFLYFGAAYPSLYVNNNGDVTFGGAYAGYSPMPFPIAGNPMIAPFFADIDTNGAGTVWYRITTDASLLAKAASDIPPILSGTNFNPTWLFIVTWDHVGYYSSHTEKTNTFQCILVANNATSFVIYLYADGLIQWTTGDNSGGSNGLGGTQAQIGFNAGNSVNYANVPGSRTPDVINIASTSNVLVPGQWIYAVHQAEISSITVAPVIDQCLPNGGKGPCPQVCVSSPGSFTCSCYNCTNGLCMNGSCWCVSTYTGENCSQPVFSGFEINSCVNGGYCDASVRDRCTCVCPQSTRGDYCENANDLCPLNSSAALALSTVIVRRRYLGASSLVPAKSCAEIKSVRREVVTGVYWTLNASGLVQLEFCQY